MAESDFDYMLASLQQPRVPEGVIELLYGFNLRAHKELKFIFTNWAKVVRGEPEVIRDDFILRPEFERFLKANELISVKNAAAKLGMKESSFEDVLTAFVNAGIVADKDVRPFEYIVRRDFVDRFKRYFHTLQYTGFKDHKAFCLGIHKAIKSEYGVEVDPLYCVTSKIIDNDDPDYAEQYDSLTDEPVGIRYGVWLEFSKPNDLHPDVCSFRTYYRHKSNLSEYIFPGMEPDLDSSKVLLLTQ